MVLPFFFPVALILRLEGVRKRRRTQRGKCPPPDSDPFNEAEFGQNLVRLSRQNAAGANRRFEQYAEFKVECKKGDAYAPR